MIKKGVKNKKLGIAFKIVPKKTRVKSLSFFLHFFYDFYGASSGFVETGRCLK